MKKIAVLMFLVICVSISGVYAAWLYTGTTVSSADITVSHGMATATTDGDVGIFEINKNDAMIIVDQTAAGDYRAKLKITGSVTVCFKPNDGAPEDVVNNAVEAVARVYVTGADQNLYEGSPIYVSTGATVDLEWVKQADGHFEATVSDEQLATLVALGDEFVLDTHAEYVAFHNLEEHLTVTVEFSKK